MKWWIFFAALAVGASLLGIKIDAAVPVGLVIFAGLYIIGVNMDKHHEEQIAKLRQMDEKIQAIERYMLWNDNTPKS
jgi:hypothetical protein